MFSRGDNKLLRMMEQIFQELSIQLGMPLEEVQFKFQKIRDTEAMYQHALQALYQTDEVIIGYTALLPMSEATRSQKNHGSITCPVSISNDMRKHLIKSLMDLLKQHHSTL